MTVDLLVGDKLAEVIPVTDESVKEFARITGDYNPIHLDDHYARSTVFSRRVAHGMLVAGFISRVLANRLGTGGIYLSQSLKFIQPVYVPDRVEISLEVLQIRPSQGVAKIGIRVNSLDQNKLCAKGEALIMTRSGVEKLTQQNS